MLKVGQLKLQSDDPHIYGPKEKLYSQFKNIYLQSFIYETQSQQTKTKCKKYKCDV